MLRNIFASIRRAALALFAALLAAGPAAAQQGWPLNPGTGWGGGSSGGSGSYGGFGGYGGSGYSPAPAYYRPAPAYVPAYSPVAPVVTTRSYSAPEVTSRYAPTAPATSAHINVAVPAGAVIWFDGARTAQKGTRRHFVSPPLTPGRKYAYEVKARWREGGQTVTRSRRATFGAGEEITVTFGPALK
jgi:uncharacterized protein (TIGR03000 family)